MAALTLEQKRALAIAAARKRAMDMASTPESDTSKNLRSELSAITQNPAKAQYDALPGWQKPLVAASDIVDLTANGLTMGFGNKAAALALSLIHI
jgi:hypothetical protein